MSGDFDDILQANRAYADGFDLSGLRARAARGLAVLTCIDSRIEPLTMLGLQPGDAKIIRNAGARASDDALRSLTLAANLLGVRRVMVVAHTDCAMAGTTDDELRRTVGSLYPGTDVAGVEFLAATDQRSTLTEDVSRIRGFPLLPADLVVAGFLYDVETGLLQPVET